MPDSPSPEIQRPDAARRRSAPLWLVMVAFVILVAFIALNIYNLILSSQGGLKMGSPAPDFNLTTFDGQQIPLSSLKGKVVLVNFWASWCNPCFDEAPILEQAWQQARPGGKVIFLGVDYVDTEGPAREFIKKLGVTFANGPDLSSDISSAYHVTGVPETFIIDAQGKLAYLKIGPFVSLDELNAILDQTLKDGAAGAGGG